MAEAGAQTRQQAQGKKRVAEDRLENEQRLSKRFNLLKIDQPNKLWISTTSLPTRHESLGLQSEPEPDYMHVEESKDRVFVRDLDEELADIAADEEKLVFLPDIEKNFIKIPKSVVSGDYETTPTDSRLVLYSVPHSLSVPEHQDSVRRAILDARARARESSFNPSLASTALANDKDGEEGSRMKVVGELFPGHGQGHGMMECNDGDAMDVE